MNEDPMDQPPAVAEPGGVVTMEITLSSRAQHYLEQTSPWVRFISILNFVCAGLMFLLGLVMMLVGLAGRLAPNDIGIGRSALPGAVAGVLLGMIYLLLACLYIAPGVFLSRYASAIRFLRSNRTADALEDAVRHQKSFWRYVGILALIGLVVAVLGLAVFLIGMSLLVARRF